MKGLRTPLSRVDLATDTTGLPLSLVDAIEADGGLWMASDAYTTADEVVDAARREHAVALRLDFRDLSFLEELHDVRYLHLRTDGRPILDPIATLPRLEALIIEARGLRGDLDPAGLPELQWLKLPIGGKGGAHMLPAVRRGHPRLEWLSLRETKARAATELCAGFPRLRSLRIQFADHLRTLGDLAGATPHLEKLTLNLTQIRELRGLAGLAHLEAIDIVGGRVRDLEPLRSIPLRYARLELPDLESIEPLRDHPHLCMVMLMMAREPDVSVLASINGLRAVGRGKGFTRAVPWPDLSELPEDNPLRVEWAAVIRR